MSSYKPTEGTFCLYKENGGINWCLCKVIAYNENKVWLQNLSVGSMPVKTTSRISFMPLDTSTANLLSCQSTKSTD